MATITLKNILQKQPYFGGITPYGNALELRFKLDTNSSGVYTEGDSTSAIGTTDVVRLGILPAGMRLSDALAIVSDAFRASTTCKLGFQYVDGVDSTDVPQDDDYFFAALALDAQGRTRAANVAVRPVVLPKDAYLIYTNAVAAQNAAGQLDVLVYGEMVGAP